MYCGAAEDTGLPIRLWGFNRTNSLWKDDRETVGIMTRYCRKVLLVPYGTLMCAQGLSCSSNYVSLNLWKCKEEKNGKVYSNGVHVKVSK
jgi:hypothetical protein